MTDVVQAPTFVPDVGYVFAKDFRVIRALRSGGMGSVYVVEQLSTGKQRALKLLNAALAADPIVRERFVFEARAASKIESDHVVEVVMAGIDEPHAAPFLVMELLRGEDLSDRLQRAGPLSIEDVAEVMAQVGHALERAHEQGIVHRDLKPENIFLAEARRRDSPFTAKILDFGIAKMVSEGTKKKSGTTQPIGSPWYMAPEQTDSRGRISPATDVWALGLIAFVCLAGREYWREAEQLTALMREIVLEPLVPASERAAEFGLARMIPPGFDLWFGRCVERDANRRFANAGECVRAFTERFQPKPTPAGLYIELPNARGSVAPPAPRPAEERDLTMEAPKHHLTAPAAPKLTPEPVSLGGLELDFEKAATGGKARLATPPPASAPRAARAPTPAPRPVATPPPTKDPFDDDEHGPASFELNVQRPPASIPRATPAPAPAPAASVPKAEPSAPRPEPSAPRAAPPPTPAPVSLQTVPPTPAAAPVAAAPPREKTLYDRIKRPLILVYVAFGLVILDIVLGRSLGQPSPLHSAWLSGPLFLIGAILVGLELAKERE